MTKLKYLQSRVMGVLTDYPETRSDDFLLMEKVLNEYIDTNMSLRTIFHHHIELGIPSFESITRARRIVQEQNPELVDSNAKCRRKKEEREFKQFVRDNK